MESLANAVQNHQAQTHNMHTMTTVCVEGVHETVVCIQRTVDIC